MVKQLEAKTTKWPKTKPKWLEDDFGVVVGEKGERSREGRKGREVKKG